MNVVSLLEVAAAILPAVEVVTGPDGTMTYSDLTASARAHAERLRSVDGSRLVTLQVPSPDHIALLYGAWAAGWTVYPLNFRLGRGDLAAQIEVASPDLIVADPRYHETLTPELRGGAPVVGGSTPTGTEPKGPLASPVPEEHPAVVIFTSGTTGVAKPVELTHSRLFTDLTSSVEPPTGQKRGATLLAVPTYHVAGLNAVLASVYMGREMVLMGAFDPEGWLATIERRKVDHAFVVPTMLRRIVDHPSFPEFDLGSLRILSYGAAAASESLIRSALEKFPPTTGFVNAYGQTETGGTVTILTPQDHRDAAASDRAEVRDRLRSIGRPLPGVSVSILGDGDVELKSGESGELAVKRSNEQAPRKTGDLARVDDDGYVFLVGRTSERIIRGGENIDPAEIEAVISELPGVLDVAVVGQSDEEWGEVVVAHVVPTHPGSVEPADITEHVRAQLAGYKAPAAVALVEELPRNSMGKVVKRELPRVPTTTTT